MGRRLLLKMRIWAFALFGPLLGLVLAPLAANAACDDPSAGLPVSRTVEIDATNGPLFGSVTHQLREPSFLKPKEVVLTFDDGPMPWVTKSILGTLDTFCTKATFFAVGRMALAYPATVRDIVARGHTLGSHTYSHPFNMPRMKSDAATSEIERGLAAVTTAAGTPIAPFFRFTGLADSRRLLIYLQTRNFATFTVDVVTNDSYIHDAAKLTERTMAEVRRHHGGIILFHDIKTTTAKALPGILANLKAEGYSVVHMTAKRSAEPQEWAMREVAPKLSAVHNGETGGETLLPFYGAVAPDSMPAQHASQTAAVTRRLREKAADEPANTARATAPVKASDAGNQKLPDPKVAPVSLKNTIADVSGPPVIVEKDSAVSNAWVTSIQPHAASGTAKAPR